jgi:hypothetical protein
MHGNRFSLAAVCLASCLLFGPSAFARQDSHSLEALPAEIERAKAEFDPIEPEEVERRRRVLQESMAGVERYLSPTDEANETAWKRYLLWDELRSETAPGAEPDLAVLRQVDERLDGTAEGLELPPFRELQSALRDYIGGVYTLTDPAVEATYGQAMEALKQLVEQYLAEPSTDLASQMGPMLEFLEQTGQAPQVTGAIRRHFRHPQVRVGVSKAMIAAVAERDVDEPTEVNEVILGTRIRGSGRTRGRVHMELVPSDDRATLALVLKAQASTHNIGVNGPVTLYSTGVTDIVARHTVYLTKAGVFAGDVTARACVRSNIYCIAAKLRIIEHFAWRQAMQSKAEGEAISSVRAARRAEEQFAEQVREQLREPNQNFQEKVLTPLTQRRLFPELLNFSTTADRLHAVMRHATERQLASPTPAPADVGGDLSVRVHESAVGNVSETALGGMTFTAEEFEEMSEGLPARSCPEAPPEQEGGDRDWSVTFRDRHPVSARFREGEAAIVIHLEQFTSEGDEFNYPIDIAAVYSIQDAADGPKLVREGRVQVTWATPRRPRFGQRAVLESKFRLRFERMFCEEFFVRDVSPPENAPEGFGVLRDFIIRSEDGWFTAGFRRIPEN